MRYEATITAVTLDNASGDVVLVGWTRESPPRRLCARVLDVPHELFVAIDSSERLGAVRGVVERVHRDLERGRAREFCARTACEFCPAKPAVVVAKANDSDDEGPAPSTKRVDQKKWVDKTMNETPCAKKFVGTDGAAIGPTGRFDVSVVSFRGFVGFEANPRPFARIRLAAAHRASRFKRALAAADFGVATALAGVYNVCSGAIESFMRLKGARCFAVYAMEGAPSRFPISRAALEIDASFASVVEIVGVKPAAPRRLVFDVETISNRPFGVSNAQTHPIGTIQLLVAIPGKTPRKRFLYWGGAIDEFDATWERVELRDEKAMLTRFRDEFLACDPDFVSGWNSNRFDLPYVCRRAELLGVKFDAGILATGRAPRLHLARAVNKSGAVRETMLVDCPGRTFYDYYLFATSLKTLSLRSYKLGDVAKELELPVLKGDVEYDEIYGLWRGSTADRTRLAKYGAGDVDVTEAVGVSLAAVDSLVGGSYVYGSHPQAECERTPGPRLARLVRAYAYPEGYLIRSPSRVAASPVPTEPSPADVWRAAQPGAKAIDLTDADADDTERHPFLAAHEAYARLWSAGAGYPGAIVLPPTTGPHERVVVLDFASLYPSVVRAFNLCCTTMLPGVPDPDDPDWPPGSYAVFEVSLADRFRDGSCDPRAPRASFAFATPAKRRGVYPKILDDLTAKRKAAKKRVVDVEQRLRDRVGANRAELEAELGLHDKMQLYFKLASNSLYGVCALKGELQNLALACTITQVGQRSIRGVERAIESKWPENDRGDESARVVYGDTDSLFLGVRGDVPMSETRAFAARIHAYVNGESDDFGPIRRLFPNTMSMEFEKIMSPMLLISRKRYAGLMYPADDRKAPSMKCSGVDSVRRGNSPFAASLVGEYLRLLIVERWSASRLVEFVRERSAVLLRGVARTDDVGRCGACGETKLRAPFVCVAPRTAEFESGRDHGICSDCVPLAGAPIACPTCASPPPSDSEPRRPRASLLFARIERESLVMTGGLSKDPDDYAVPAAHTVAATQLRNAGFDVLPGDRIAYYFVDRGPSDEKIARRAFAKALADVAPDVVYDYGRYFERIVAPLETLMRCHVPPAELPDALLALDATTYDRVVANAKPGPFDRNAPTRIVRASDRTTATSVPRIARRFEARPKGTRASIGTADLRKYFVATPRRDEDKT